MKIPEWVLWTGGLLLLTGLVVFVCVKFEKQNRPIQSQSVIVPTNSTFYLELLFVHEGVKVYRFYDCGRYKYYTDARGAASWDDVYSNGKTQTVIPQEIQTVK